MINIFKKIILTTLSLVVLSGVVVGANRVYAQSNSGKFADLVQMIADKFGLNKADVQSVFDQFHTQKQNQMETNFENRLSLDVTNGKITEAQRQAIIAKFKELQQARLTDQENWKNLTPDQRKTKMNEQRTALETWATQNGISTTYLQGLRFGFGKGFGMKRYDEKW